MCPTAEEIIDIKNRLAEAKSAYHRLQLGGAAVEVRDSDGSSIRYNMSNASRLKAYIAELEGLLLGCDRIQMNKLPLRPVWG